MAEIILLTLVVGVAAGAACTVAVVYLIDRAYQEYIEQIQPPFTDKEHDDGR